METAVRSNSRVGESAACLDRGRRSALIPAPFLSPQELQRAGITFLSIAHRPTLRRFHSRIVHFDGSLAGSGGGLGWRIEEPGQQQKAPLPTPPLTPSRVLTSSPGQQGGTPPPPEDGP